MSVMRWCDRTIDEIYLVVTAIRTPKLRLTDKNSSMKIEIMRPVSLVTSLDLVCVLQRRKSAVTASRWWRWIDATLTSVQQGIFLGCCPHEDMGDSETSVSIINAHVCIKWLKF